MVTWNPTLDQTKAPRVAFVTGARPQQPAGDGTCKGNSRPGRSQGHQEPLSPKASEARPSPPPLGHDPSPWPLRHFPSQFPWRSATAEPEHSSGEGKSNNLQATRGREGGGGAGRRGFCVTAVRPGPRRAAAASGPEWRARAAPASAVSRTWGEVCSAVLSSFPFLPAPRPRGWE